jgi:hypothetical protein
MSRKRISAALALAVLTVAFAAAAQNASNPSDQAKKGAKQPARTAAPRGELAQAELEQRFAKTLTGATLKGSWQMTREQGLAGKAPLSEPREDKYSIVSVNKQEDDWWLFKARIEYGENDLTLPIRLRVVWAGDTAVITVDDFGFPGIGLYSARVMIYGNFYSGVWYGTNYGGVMSGQIVRSAKEKTAEPETPDGADK